MGDKKPKKPCLNPGSFATAKLHAKKRSISAILAITLVFAITAVGCDVNVNFKINGNNEDEENPIVIFTRVTAGGSPTTTHLELTFSDTIYGLSASNITLDGVPGVTKEGTINRSGTTWTLPINVTAGGTLTVEVKKEPYTIIGSPKTVNISYNGGGGAPTVTSVTVSPATADVDKGATKQFSATVAGTNTPSQTVTWSIVETGKNSGTFINASSGLLTIAPAETLTSLTIRATSQVDTTKYGEATVTVTAPTPTVTGVTVSPSTVTVATGKTQNFTATVTGTNSPAQGVTWSIDGTHAVGTAITTPGGVLTVAADEAQTSLTVRATSTFDTSKSGTATVTVVKVTSVDVTPLSVSVDKGGTQNFTATVTGTNSPPQTVTWSIVETGKNSSTIINASSGVLSIAAAETLTSLTIRATSTADTTKYGEATVNVTTPTGSLTITITFPITDEAEFTPTTTSVVKSTLLSGDTNILLTAPTGLTGITWSIGGETISGATSNSLTIDNDTKFLKYFAGNSFVVNVQGTKDSKLYSKSVTITLTGGP